MKATLLGLVAAAVAAVALAAPSLAAGPPIVARPFAAGTMQATTINAAAGTMLFETIRIAPGGSFGWHVHGAPAAVVVTGGTLTVFDPTVNGCAPFRVSKGSSFVEPANHVHLARNDGRTPATVDVVFLGLPKGVGSTAPAAEPAGCSASR